MNRPLLAALVLASSFVAVIVAVPSRAYACSSPACQPVAAPAHGAVVPSNAPAFPVLLCAAAPDSALTLFDGQGVAVPTTIVHGGGDSFLIEPSAPLVPGADYKLSFPGLSGAIVFSAGPSAPLPSTAAHLTIASTATSAFQLGGSSCANEVPAAGVHLDIQPSADMIPYLPLTTWSTLIDGVPWASSPFGSKTNATGNPAWDKGVAQVDFVYALCGPDAHDANIGHHAVTVRAHVAGAMQDPPAATLDVDLVCATPSPSDCSVVAPGGASDGASMLLALAPLVVVLRRRRAVRR